MEGGYRLAAGTQMPPLLLDDEEAVAIALGLRTVATNAVDRDRRSVRPRTGQARAGHAAAPSKPVRGDGSRHRVAQLGRAGRRSRPSSRRSRGRSGPASGCASATEPRTTRRRGGTSSRTGSSRSAAAGTSSRGTSIAATGGRSASTGSRIRGRPAHAARDTSCPTASTPSRSSSARRSPRRRPTRWWRRSRRRPRTSRGGWGTRPCEIEPLGDDRCRITGAADTLPWLAFRLLQLDADFEVHEPPELRAVPRSSSATGCGEPRPGRQPADPQDVRNP